MRFPLVALIATCILVSPISKDHLAVGSTNVVRQHAFIGPTLDHASWYGEWHHGRTTANGEQFDMFALTAAHRSLPFGTRLRVTDLRTGRFVIVRINDRGPHWEDRSLDLSYGAAEQLGIVDKGTAHVRIEVVTEREAASDPTFAQYFMNQG
jgi:rare lipoprotein A